MKKDDILDWFGNIFLATGQNDKYLHIGSH